jgi:hypothetical protein
MRNIHTLAILDRSTGVIVRSWQGDWSGQHDAHVLPNGHVLFFDNGRNAGRSRALELDETGNVAWEWGGPPGEPMLTACCGIVERMPNGNTVVTESEAGRVFEVTPTGEVVWRFDSPHRPPDRPQMVATLFALHRIPREEVAWLTH